MDRSLLMELNNRQVMNKGFTLLILAKDQPAQESGGIFCPVSVYSGEATRSEWCG